MKSVAQIRKELDHIDRYMAICGKWSSYHNGFMQSRRKDAENLLTFDLCMECKDAMKGIYRMQNRHTLMIISLSGR